MTSAAKKTELKKLALQIIELKKIYRASNLTDKKVQAMLTESLIRKNYLNS